MSRSQATAPFDTSTHSRLVVKLAILLSVLLVTAILTAGLFHYDKNRDLILKNLQIQLQLAANTIAISIDGDAYQTLKGRESLDTPEYREIRGDLEAFVRENRYLGFDENDIYIFRRVSDDSLEFTVMLQDEFVGNRYPIREEMWPTIDRKETSFTNIYEDENGMWVSAYAPIITDAGKCVGIVEVDYKDNIYLTAVLDEIYVIAFFSLAAIFVAIATAIVVSRLLTRPIVAVSEAAGPFASGELDVSVPVSTRDEIGMLARAFNHMVKEVKEMEVVRKKNVELQEAYRKLDELNHSLVEANRLKSEFLSIAAHDLKSPLQVIRGFAELILEHRDADAKIHRNARKIQGASQRMLNIIGQLLDMTAIEHGKMELTPQPTDLAVVLREVAESLDPLATKKSQKIHFEAAESCLASVDGKWIRDVFENLISNAIKFSPQDRDIILRVFRATGVESGNDWIRCEVSDQGPGLTAEDQANLFGKFSRLSAQPTGGESSTGLGLAIAREIVERHSGRIGAISKGVDKGSTFFVEFPQAVSQNGSQNA